MYQNYLTMENAQKIADEIMKIVPINVNIADTEGVILASGDRSTVGSLHRGALTALKKKEPHLVYESTEDEVQGINLPVLYNNEIIGVICINGAVQEVMMAGQICMSMTLLMFENQLLNDMSIIRENRLKDFFFEWISKTEAEYDESFYDQAAYLHVDVTIPRTAVIITSRRIRYSVMENIRKHLQKGEYIVRQRMSDILILLKSEKEMRTRLEQIMELSRDLCCCYIGESDVIASKTVASVNQMFSISKKLGIVQGILTYAEVSLECLFSSVPPTRRVEELIKILEEKDTDGVLQETIKAYVDNNDNYAAICDKLYVHRNTLNYRLSRIEELCSCNPRKARDLMLLYIAVMKIETGECANTQS